VHRWASEKVIIENGCSRRSVRHNIPVENEGLRLSNVNGAVPFRGPRKVRLFIVGRAGNSRYLKLLNQFEGADLGVDRTEGRSRQKWRHVGLIYQITAGRDGVDRISFRKRVGLPLVVPHHVLHPVEILNLVVIPIENLGTRVQVVIEPRTPLLDRGRVAGNHINVFKVGDVITGEIALSGQQKRNITALRLPGNLLNDPKSVIGNGGPRSKFVVVNYLPLVIVRAAVVSSKDLGPLLTIARHAVGHDVRTQQSSVPGTTYWYRLMLKIPFVVSITSKLLVRM